MGALVLEKEPRGATERGEVQQKPWALLDLHLPHNT